MPMGFPVAGFVSALEYRAQDGDVFVATYPKCGTTWMQHIVWLLAHEGRPLSGDQRLTEAFPHLEEVGSAAVEALPQPRLIKTHLPFSMTPYSASARYVVVARNPFDCAVSFYHHTRGFPHHYDFADDEFDDYFECYIEGRVDFGGYFDHLVPWGARADDDNVIFLTYEAMKADPRRAITDVGQFLGGVFGEAVGDADTLERVLEHSSFKSMSKDQQRWSSERAAGAAPFVRKGSVGDWSNQFSPEQARRLAREFDARTAGTWMSDLWPDVLNQAREGGEGREGATL